MPHIVVEHPEKLGDVINQELLIQLHNALANHDTVAKEAIKTRAISFSQSVVGEDDQDNLNVHVTLRLLPGRSVELRKSMAQDLYMITKTTLHEHYPSAAVSTEVVELDGETYIK